MNKSFKKCAIFASTLIFISILFSCQSTGKISSAGKKGISRSITGPAKLSAEQLAAYFMDANPAADIAQVYRLATYYIEESNAEGINSDVAFAQMCHETGFLKFGNLVKPEMNNYCGLGAINAENPGLWFKSERQGVRAHIQHLHAYGTTSDVQLHKDLIDPRYKYVNPRGKAPTIFELAGTWAADREYGTKLDAKLDRMNDFKKWKGKLELPPDPFQ